jgi:uncharacterized protein (UPF0332 family)
MPFDWNQYLNLANELAQRSDEASLRSAVSRAYYGTLCLSRNYLIAKGELDKNKISKEKDSHMVVWGLFSNKGKTRNGVYQNAQRLKFKRTQSDYEDVVMDEKHKTVTDLQAFAAMALRDANNLIHYLNLIT